MIFMIQKFILYTVYYLGKQMTDNTKKLSTVQYSDALDKYVDKNVGPSEW